MSAPGGYPDSRCPYSITDAKNRNYGKMKKCLLILVLLIAGTVTVPAQKPGERSAEIVLVDGQEFYLHTVAEKETLYSLSKLYDVPISRIEFDNPQVRENGLKAHEVIKILCERVPEVKMSPRKMSRTFTGHTVARGETTYSIARRYSLSVNVLVQDNPGLDPANLAPGQTLKIRKSEIGGTAPGELLNEIDNYAETLNKVSEGYVYHVVEAGETIYSLSRKMGVTEEAVAANNNLSDGLKAGMLLKIPTAGRTADPLRTGVNPVDWSKEPPADPVYIYNGMLRVAIMLPFSGPSVSASSRNNFVEFYQGTLLALEDLKRMGYSVSADLYDTGRSPEQVASIVGSPQFRSTNLIVGPVYEDCLEPAMAFARDNKVPVVSPLADIADGYGDMLYQLSPMSATRYDKLREMFRGDKNIVFLAADSVDVEFERDMKALVGDMPYQRVVYRKSTPGDYLDSLLVDPTRENLYVVVAGDELGVDMILASLSSVQNNRLARSIRTGPFRVIGNSRWMRYKNVDRNLLFKLNVSFVTNYHADRTSDVTGQLDRRYIAAFDAVPSLYSYRGYDAVKLFAEALLANPQTGFQERLNNVSAPLQTGYSFVRGETGNNVNREWALVKYKSNYTIEVE